MSRTFRRNKKHLIDSYLGTRDAFFADRSWAAYRYPTLTLEQAYDHARTRYTRDHHSGQFSVPRWFRRHEGSKRVRLQESRAILRHLQTDSWDAHSPDGRCRGAEWRWF